MSFLNNFRLAVKLPAFILVFSVAIAFTVGIVSFLTFRSSSLDQTEIRLNALAHDRGAAVESWIDAVMDDVIITASFPATANAFKDFDRAWDELDEDGRASMQQAYVTDNPNGVGERHLLSRAHGTQDYHAQHANYHPSFRQMLEARGYYDIFLVNPQGDIVYSVFKESDFGENLLEGDLANSGLAQSVQASLKGRAGVANLVDFAPYGPSNGAYAGFVSVPVLGQFNQVLGVFAVQMPVDQLNGILNAEVGLGETGETVLMNQNLEARSVSRFENGHVFGADFAQTGDLTDALAGAEIFNAQAVNADGDAVMRYAYPIDFGGMKYLIMAQKSRAEILSPVNLMGLKLLGISLASAAFLGVFGWLFGRTITTPIANVQARMADVANGNLHGSVPEAERGDEIGAMARVLQTVQKSLQAARQGEVERAELQAEQQVVVQEISHGLLRMSEGDFSQPIDQNFGPTYDKLRIDFNKTLQQLSDIISEVTQTAQSVGSGAAQISQGSESLSTRTENQAATLEETAAALDEMTASVRSAAEGAKSVANTVNSAKSEAEDSGRVVERAVTAMGQIEESSTHISQIIGTIEDIAFQTNLLALNAGVEAARAGDAGKGFAVVASEVRALAQRSSEAAREIKALIVSSTGQVEEGAKLVGQAGVALAKIVERVGDISQLISEIATGAQEQSTGLDEINLGVTELDRVTQENAAMVDQSSAASLSLKSDASRLVSLVSHFASAASVSNVTTAPPVVAPEISEIPETPTAHGEVEELRVRPVEVEFSEDSRREDVQWAEF